MKVGTDGVLLGAWARGGRRVLDAGTGTGIIALMMAQRYAEARVTAIDIDDDAVREAAENVRLSPFASRVSVYCQSVQQHAGIWHGAAAQHTGEYDAVVSNPPFFSNSPEAPDRQRAMARHTATLTYGELMRSAWQLLAGDGELSVVVPFDYRRSMEDEATFVGFFPSRVCAVRTTPRKPPRRFLLAFSKHPQSVERTEITIGDEAYTRLTADFYL